MAITAVYHTTGYPGFVGTCNAWFSLVYKQKHKDINKMAEEASFFVYFSCAYKHKHKKNENVRFSCAYAYCVLLVFSLAYTSACACACAYAYALVNARLKSAVFAWGKFTILKLLGNTK